jgi:putative peptidoglycan lipid II flippase
MPEAPPQRVSTRATGIVAIAVLCSRILGLVREQVFAGLFGATRNLDIFLIAFRVPNLLRDLFAEGALSTAFITTFSKKIATEGDRSAWELANKVATLTAIFMSAVTIVGIIFSHQIIGVIGRGFNADDQAMTTLLTQIMWPFILLVSLAALAMGMLNAKHVFGMPAMASTFFNVGSIIAGVAVGWWLDPQFGQRALVGLAIGTLVGGALQFLVQVPALWRVGYRFRPNFIWRDPGVRTILVLMGPAVIAASAVQVNVLVNSTFASYLAKGAVAWLSIAFRLMQLPLGIFGVAVATVALPLVSKSAAVGDIAGFRSALAHGIRLVFLLTIPSAVGLFCLAEPIIAVIYQHGRFTPEATRQTAVALQFYAIGLAAYSGVKVLAPAFYALDRRYLPMAVSIFSIITNLILNWFFTFHLGFGHRGLALSVSVVAIINFLLLYMMMLRYAGPLETGALFGLLGKLLIPLALLAGICWLSLETMFYPGAHLPEWQKVFGVLLTISVAAVVFFGSAFLFRVNEVRDVVNLIRRKLGRKNQPSA